MAATRAVAPRPSHLFDGSARTVAWRPHTPFGNGQPCKRGIDRKTRAEHDHGAQAPRAISYSRGPAHPATAIVRNRCVTVSPFGIAAGIAGHLRRIRMGIAGTACNASSVLLASTEGCRALWSAA